MGNTLRVISVVGARPNFMKIAPLARAINAHNAGGGTPRIEHRLVHTGQHYDVEMSAAFFDALDIPAPDVDLGIGSGTHAQQVGQTMIAFEQVLRDWPPDWVLVVGDVNATCACTITAKKEHLKVAHIEAGLRSFDQDMPEEINRLVTDRLADVLFTTDHIADANLRAEGTADERIRFVGNIMIDTLDAQRELAAPLKVADIIRDNAIADGEEDAARFAGTADGDFAVLTLHRPSNVDDPHILPDLVAYFIDEVAARMPLVWTLHPRTRNRLEASGLLDRVLATPNIVLLRPIGYREMLRLNMSARIILTDSGGIQEECCVLGTPCVTLRWNTERPITLTDHGGTNVLAGNDVARIRDAVNLLMEKKRVPHRPELWDGHTAERIVRYLAGTRAG